MNNLWHWLNQGNRFAIAFLLLHGGIFLAIGIGTLINTLRHLDNGVRASGTVTALRRSDDVVYPTVRFPVNGDPLEFEAAIGTGTGSYVVGETVTVLYDEARPRNATIVSFTDLWLFPLIFGGVGLVEYVIAAAIGLFGRRK